MPDIPTLLGEYPLQTAKIDQSASGDTTVVTGIAGKYFVVLGFFFSTAAAVSAKWMSGSNDLTGAMPFAANGGISVESEVGIMECNVGESLILNLSGISQTGGSVAYVTLDSSVLVTVSDLASG
jgi:hypothetical protein